MLLSSQQQDVLLLTGWLHLQYGQPERARILLVGLLKLHPAHLAGRRALLVSLLRQGKGEEALTHIEQLMGESDMHTELWLCLSRAYLLIGRIDEARHAYQYYIELEEQNESTLP